MTERRAIDTAALLDFVLVATHGGFRRASRATGRSTTTLSRHVAELETSIGVRLVERNEKALRLTEAGARLLAQTRGPLAEINEVAQTVGDAGGELRGRLRISSAVVFAHAHLVRIACAFSLANPLVEIEIDADDRMVDPVEAGFDIVIRANPDADDRLVGRCIVRTDRVAVAAPMVAKPAAAEAARLIFRSADTPAPSWRLRVADCIETIPLNPVLGLSTLLMMRKAAIEGVGAAVLPRTMIVEDLAAGRLLEWGVLEGPLTEIWALHTSRRLPGAKVTAFLALLAAFRPDPSNGGSELLQLTGRRLVPKSPGGVNSLLKAEKFQDRVTSA